MWRRKPKPMRLDYGEPIHQMVARALMSGAILVQEGTLSMAEYHFVGSHGIEYKGLDVLWQRDVLGDAEAVAQLCEEVQQDYNERIAARTAARAYAIDKKEVPPLFRSALPA